VVPALPDDHPPTLFLHGELDAVVPVSAMTPYADALLADGVETRTVLDPEAGHEWLTTGAREIPIFFRMH
jgi:dipeptidyl aminopeptidase/acylaminoacyl peptidase